MTPLQYLPRGDAFVVVASARGAPRPPAWWLNLSREPGARVLVRKLWVNVRAREAVGDERASLWRELSSADAWLDRAAAKAGRQLPVVVLEPS